MGHPDLQSFTAQAAETYAVAARAQGASVQRVNLGELDFDPVLRQGYRQEQPLEPDLERVRAQLVAADHVVFAFPVWWSAPPALVKGFIDRVFTPGFAFKYQGKALPKRLLGGRSARFITSMDAPGFWYRLRMRSVLHTQFVVGTLEFVGFAPVRSSTFYGMRHMPEAQRARALAEVHAAALADLRSLRARAPALAARRAY